MICPPGETVMRRHRMLPPDAAHVPPAGLVISIE